MRDSEGEVKLFGGCRGQDTRGKTGESRDRCWKSRGLGSETLKSQEPRPALWFDRTH